MEVTFETCKSKACFQCTLWCEVYFFTAEFWRENGLELYGSNNQHQQNKLFYYSVRQSWFVALINFFPPFLNSNRQIFDPQSLLWFKCAPKGASSFHHLHHHLSLSVNTANDTSCRIIGLAPHLIIHAGTSREWTRAKAGDTTASSKPLQRDEPERNRRKH